MRPEMYGEFAAVYDIFMASTPYEKWVEFLEDIWMSYGQKPRLVLELGCGTGNMTARLNQKGYDMIGIDNSAEMLSAAMDKEAESAEGSGILYVQQDMRSFELYGTVDAVVSFCDCINYLLEEDELLKVFKLVRNYLNPGGLFVFDANTPYKYRCLLGNRVFTEVNEDSAYIWENHFDGESAINEYHINFFVQEDMAAQQTLYHRFQETHYQRAYTADTVRRLLEEAGFELMAVYADVDQAKPAADENGIKRYPDLTASSRRMHFVARAPEPVL